MKVKFTCNALYKMQRFLAGDVLETDEATAKKIVDSTVAEFVEVEETPPVDPPANEVEEVAEVEETPPAPKKETAKTEKTPAKKSGAKKAKK